MADQTPAEDAGFSKGQASAAPGAGARRGGEDPHRLDIVVLGPIGAGKTTMVKALRHPADTAHSFAGRFSVEALDAAARDESARPAPAATPKRRLGLFAKRRKAEPSAADDPLPALPPPPEKQMADGVLVDGFRRVGPESAAASYARRLREDVAEGLSGDATAAALIPIPFTLVVRPQESGRGRARTTAFSLTAVDTKGGVFAESPEDKPEAVQGAFRDEQEAVFARLGGADAALICLPADEPELDPSRRRSMQTALAKLANRWAEIARQDPKRRFQVVVAITKFERLFLDQGRHAFLAASSRGAAGPAAQAALTRDWSWLLPRLRELDAAAHVTLRVQPVSAFGFIPGDGGANLDPSTGLLRTRPYVEADGETPPDAALAGAPTLDAPYTFEAVFAHYWRPFLVLDPFIQIATGEAGALSFALDPDGGEARG